MNTSTERDIGPLTWVKGEIDLALERAAEALNRHGQDDADTTGLKTARANLHQAHGALSIVGFDGVTRFSEALDQLLEAVEDGIVVYDPSVATTASNAIAAIRNYLEDLVAGLPDQPLRLLPTYQALFNARGQGEPSPADLFFPDLSVRPPQRAQEPPTLDPTDFVSRIKAVRLAYERGLLKWLREDPRGIQEMRSALAAIESTQAQPAARAFWWVGLAFMDALAAGAIGSDSSVRRICARIDTQMKRLTEGSRTVAERLMRNTLYYVAVAGPSVSEHSGLVNTTYHLDNLVPKPGAIADIEPFRPILRACHDQLAPAMEDWNRFCAGTASALPQFHDRVRNLVGRIDELKQRDLSRLGAAILGTTDELRRTPLNHNEALALEMATALLLTDHALEGYQHLGEEFAEQAAMIGNRLNAALRGEPLAAMEIPHLDEMSRQAQEKLLLGQVVKEIQVNLGTIEQSLDAYFRDAGRIDELAGLNKPIKQIEGALTVLGQERAVEVLNECETAISGFIASPQDAEHAAFEEVADKFSALGFFVEQLQHGAADIDRYLRTGASTASMESEEPTAEVELDRARRLTRTLVGALRNQPTDDALRDEIRQSLEVVRDNAELVDDTTLMEQASAAIFALENEQPSLELAEAIAHLAPVEKPSAAPSAEAARLVEASSEEIDAELLGIFIEEAHEVLATINAQLPQLASHPHDRDALTTVRRSFHTLKGSGRMVGLSELGEVAWAVEQVLNRWLQQEYEATPRLQAMLRQAHTLFGDWVVQLESGGGLHHDATDLTTVCEALKSEATSISTAPPEEAHEAPPSWEPEPEVASESFADDTGDSESNSEPVSETEIITVESVPETEEPETEEVPPGFNAEPPRTPRTPALHLVSSAPEEPSIAIGDLRLSPALYDLYISEAQGYVATLEREVSNGGPPHPSLVRAAHTLAGISATTDVDSVHGLAHALEMALNRLGAANAAPTEDQQLILARAIGALEGMIGAIANRRLPETEDSLAAALDALSPITGASAVDGSEIEVIEAEELISPAPDAGDAVPMQGPAEDEDRRHLRLADELDEQLLPIFLEESTDLMRDIGAGLRAWREHPGDQQVSDQLKRVLHTLKGSARMAGAMSVGELVHSMETRVEQAVAADAMSPAFLDTLDASFDRVSVLMDRLQGGEEVPEPESTPEPPSTDAIAATVTTLHAGPAPVAAPQAEPHPEFHDPEAATRNMLRVRADIVDKLVNEAGEIAIARGRIEGEMRSVKASLLDLTENVIRLRNQLRDIEIQAELQMQSRQALSPDADAHFDPLEFDRFTRFQELTRMMAESVNDVATAQQSLLLNLDHADAALVAQARLNREHSQALMSVRMVPFNTLADRLYRVVRQTAKELGRRANLDIRGGQTELDRSVLEKMTGPIEHLLRNAVVHGLETADRRLAAGKADIGEISLRVGQEGNEIAIELSDDGAGLDFEKIRARGVASDLISEGQEVTNEQLTELIFHPGFSTAESLTSVAGRGVGLDVVRNEAANLGGRIHIDSTPGQGSRFLIHLPLTLAITQAVLVRAGARHYAIPSSMVAQVRELKPETIAAVRAEGATSWLGNQYPWHYLPRLLGNPDAQPEPARRHWLLLLRTGDQNVAIEVDDLLGNQELVVKNIGPQLARVVGIAGATVLGDGEIILILNPLALVGRTTAPRTSAADESEPPAAVALEAAPAKVGLVMVVDDSLTVRKITGRLLAREGYHVITAKDGVDALEQLIDLVPDVMLVDIEMPRMDGFDLTRNVRADERLRDIPIIMITSRIADKHRNYAREIGVNHYLGKPYDEDELLKIIAGYTGKDT
ncbi:MAG: Hpt domain-containing protein [Gammaproteobacteria bacterium]|nr:Hpt domain-containing protein [Gammaproteobacteria bacterium]MBU1414555.1 Hpt domain-containing protein [Gammaproteobacteria bacterium]